MTIVYYAPALTFRRNIDSNFAKGRPNHEETLAYFPYAAAA